MNARIKDITERLARTDVEDTDTMIVELAKVTIAVRALTVDDMREDCPPGVKSAHLRVGVDLFQAAADATAMLADSLGPDDLPGRDDYMGKSAAVLRRMLSRAIAAHDDGAAERIAGALARATEV